MATLVVKVFSRSCASGRGGGGGSTGRPCSRCHGIFGIVTNVVLGRAGGPGFGHAGRPYCCGRTVPLGGGTVCGNGILAVSNEFVLTFLLVSLEHVICVVTDLCYATFRLMRIGAGLSSTVEL